MISEPLQQAIEAFLPTARAAYEEAKIKHNAGLISFAVLENVRRKLEDLEASATKLINRREPVR